MPIDQMSVTYLPPKYKLYGEQRGAVVGAFGRQHDRQRMMLFVGPSPKDGHPHPLQVMMAEATSDPLEPLVATGGRAGEIRSKGAEGTVVYHDGVWRAGRGLDERPLGDIYVHWATDECHSITVYSPSAIVAARSSILLSVDELQRIALAVRYN